MLDGRFPYLDRFDNYREVDGRVRRCVAEIERRTGTGALVNKMTRRVTFRYGESLGGPFGAGIEEMRRWTGGDVDEAVRIIQMGKMTARQKDAIASDNKLRQESDKRSREDRVLDNATPGAQDYVAHNDRARRGVKKVISV